MTEDELLAGITGALTAGGWFWTHHRRSDLAQLMGTSGFPDIFAVHPERGEVFIAELKSQYGRLEPLQVAWLEAFEACGLTVRVVRPANYDEVWPALVGDRRLR